MFPYRPPAMGQDVHEKVTAWLGIAFEPAQLILLLRQMLPMLPPEPMQKHWLMQACLQARLASLAAGLAQPARKRPVA